MASEKSNWRVLRPTFVHQYFRLLTCGVVIVCSMASHAIGQSDDAAIPTVEEPGLKYLDQATEKKFSVSNLSDLDVVVSLCREALDKGLSSENEKFAREMVTATLYEKANRLVEPALVRGNSEQWGRRRSMATEALMDALKFDADHAESHLLLARIDLLPGGDSERGLASANRAIELLAKTPARQSLAYVTRSRYREDVDQRLADLDLAIESDPESSDAWRERGRVRLVTGKIAEAIEDFQKLLEFDKDNVEAMDALARAFAEEKEFDEAMSLVDRMIELDADSAEPYALRATIWRVQEKWDEALADLNKAMEIEPSDPRHVLARAMVYESMQRYDDAMQDVNRVLSMAPGSAQALLLKVSLLIAQDRFAEAATVLRPIARVNPDNQPLRMQLAALYAAAKQPKEAIDVYTDILDVDDGVPLALRGRADAYLSIGDHAAAVADYEQALTVRPEDDGILNNLSWVLSTSTIDEVRDGKRALEFALKACELTEYKQAHILSTLASAYAELGDFEKAIEWSQKAVELGEEEMKPQLEKELQSYQEGKPWREMQTLDEPNDSDLEVNSQDLKLDTASAPQDSTDSKPADTPRIPHDP